MEHRIDYVPDSYLDAPYQRQFDGEDEVDLDAAADDAGTPEPWEDDDDD